MTAMPTGPVAEVLAHATSTESVRPDDARAGAEYLRVVAGGRAYFLKRLSPASDWVMRVTGDHVHRPYLVWRAGLMDKAPGCIDHTVVAMEVAGTGDDATLSMLMRDVGAYLVPPGDAPVPLAQHNAFLIHMAELAASFWGWNDDIGLTTMSERVRFFAPDNIAAELTVADVPGPIAAAAEGWRRLPALSPALWEIASLVHDRPDVVARPLAQTPPTFLQGDWKMGNLGSHPDGRTILLDWAYPGSGPACWDLCWYLALNRARLPEPKEAAIDRFRSALEACGVGTDPWWDRQLDLCTIAIMATFGWEKALGDPGELAWWQDRAVGAAQRWGLPLRR
jgi:hypothetical protein